MATFGMFIEQIDIAKQEDALPRHEHVIEEDDGIHLLEARAERMVEVRAPRSKLSRQRNFSPGVPHGMAKLTATGYGSRMFRPMRGE